MQQQVGARGSSGGVTVRPVTNSLSGSDPGSNRSGHLPPYPSVRSALGGRGAWVKPSPVPFSDVEQSHNPRFNLQPENDTIIGL